MDTKLKDIIRGYELERQRKIVCAVICVTCFIILGAWWFL